MSDLINYLRLRANRLKRGGDIVIKFFPREVTEIADKLEQLTTENETLQQRVAELESHEIRVLKHMAENQLGLSARTLAGLAAGVKTGTAHPWDADDFNRCLEFLAAFPEHRELALTRAAELSSAWKKLVDRWDEIESCLLDEVGLGCPYAKAAPKTYALMKEVLQDD